MKKVVIVTGASSGIGKEIYEGYKNLGNEYNVCGLSRRGPDIKIDLSEYSLTDLYGSGIMPDDPNILINCAGVMPLNELGREEELMNLNFWGAYKMIDYCLTENLELVINIASVAAYKPDPHQPIYAASKAALIAMTKSYAKRYAKDGIKFNSISPGFIESNLVPGETPSNLIEEIPMKYEAPPYVIFQAVRFIERCSYLNGADVVVDGGLIC